MKQDMYEQGLYHVFSKTVNKYELVSMINERFKLNVILEPFETEVRCNRTLLTIKNLNKKLNIPIIKEQLWQI